MTKEELGERIVEVIQKWDDNETGSFDRQTWKECKHDLVNAILSIEIEKDCPQKLYKIHKWDTGECEICHGTGKEKVKLGDLIG